MKTLAPDVVLERQKRMSALKHELATNYLKKQIGMPVNVLFETQNRGVWCGHSPNYVKVYSKNGEHNEIRLVTPTHVYLDGVAGRLGEINFWSIIWTTAFSAKS